MNATQVQEFLAPLGNGSSWNDKCIRALKDGDPLEVAQGFVARYGTHDFKYLKDHWDIWGIDIATCHNYCSRAQFPMQFNFSLFSSGITNYFLPWLGLTAQLPYETASSFNNFMSFCLAVGSPMLTTFSLISTALNSHWTSKRFSALVDNQLNSDFRKGAKAARDFLRGSQQAPMRINRDEFDALINDDPADIRSWWDGLQRRLEKTRRPVTFSLVAQTVFALTAWVLTIAGSYDESLGIPSQALLLSSGTLWTWLIPVVVGWMVVGMQAHRDTIKDALEDPSINRAKPALRFEFKRTDGTKDVPETLLRDVRGDEILQGPAFNYARIFTYYSLVQAVASAFESKLKSIRQSTHHPAPSRKQLVPYAISVTDDTSDHGESPDSHELTPVTSRPSSPASGGSHSDSNGQADRTSTSNRRQNTHLELPSTNSNHGQISHRRKTSNEPLLSIDRAELSRALDYSTGGSANLPHQSISVRYQEYAPWSTLDSQWKLNFIVSNMLAIFLHWGVTGAALVISYLTEVQGLGCRAGSYLLYGVLGTVAHISLLGSAFLSHQAMLVYDKEHNNRHGEYQPHGWHSFICALAVFTRFFGKFIAVCNALWIILSSIWELIGFYDSCYCTGTMLGLGNKAWVILFVSAIEMRENAEPSWAGGIVMSGAVGLITFLIVWRYSHESKS